MRFGIRLDDPAVAALSCTELYRRYLQAKELGVLPPSNISPHEFWVK
jgi:hypothetical protein